MTLRSLTGFCFLTLTILLFVSIDSAHSYGYDYTRKFRITGLVELTYRDFSTEVTSQTTVVKNSWSSFEQNYALGVDGYVYHPRLIVFSTSIGFTNEKTGGDSNGDMKNVNYDFSASFLPDRPISLDINATKSHSTVEGWNTVPYEATSNSYGARLRISTKVTPSTLLEYSHFDYTTDREQVQRVYETPEKYTYVKKVVKERSDFDKFDFHIDGTIKMLKTRYTLTGDFFEYSGPEKSYTGQTLGMSTSTAIKKDNILSTHLTYSDIDISRMLFFETALQLSPIHRFYHTYSYDYSKSETEKDKSYFHTFTGLWNYRFNSLFRGRANFRYRLGNKGGDNETFYDTDISLQYRRPIKTLDFISDYTFSHADKQKDGQDITYFDHNFGLGLTTKYLTSGRIYSNYDFSYKTYESSYTTLEEINKTEQFHTLEHRLKTGVHGKGPGRAYWRVEAEGRYFDLQNGAERPKGILSSQEELWGEKIRHYTLTGDVRYPLSGKWAIFFLASYTTGLTNSQEAQKYLYESRVNYSIMRNLTFSAWYRQEWLSKGWYSSYNTDSTLYSTRTTEYQINIYYRWNKMYFSLEYDVSTMENSTDAETKHLFLNLRKPI